ncbi:hypothetical protein [Leptolyngbya sp. 7M]|uniref:hypothetical protein n=1 Tax=Leptolyngbya sp. 7M TaxID=2812896 RepID=UPI001B8B8E81|nr:hypothetical protein [Leptolyngbya sp. 7M]QYO62139.1 hypothetical protein JVX88_18670 [Leptolyngbya sp. 7M]
MFDVYIDARHKYRDNAVETAAIGANDLSQLGELGNEDTDSVMQFLGRRPVHTVVMSSFIQDNGIVNPLNRGKFYGYFREDGELEGVALIGHTTLVEARSDRSLRAFALKARYSETPINLIMSDGENAERFFGIYAVGGLVPRLKCTELLFQTDFPFPVQQCSWEVKYARPEELMQTALAQADLLIRQFASDCINLKN